MQKQMVGYRLLADKVDKIWDICQICALQNKSSFGYYRKRVHCHIIDITGELNPLRIVLKLR